VFLQLKPSVIQEIENMDEVPKRQDSNGHEPREYFGYAPVSPQDLPYEEDVDSILRVREERIVPDTARLRDHGRHSWLMVIFSVFFLSALVVLAVWQYLITTCRVKRLCNVTDASSLPSTKYLFKTFEFLIPVDYLWAAVLTGSLGLFIVCCVAYSVIRMDVGTPRMVEIASFIQEGSTSFFTWELRISTAVATALFILVGVGINWRMAGSYGIGAILSLIVGLAAVSMATRGNSRAAAAAQAGARQAFDVAFRTGSVLSVSIVSIGTVGISAAYLMFQDIRALAGFAAGASTIALVLRLGGGIYAKSADAGADLFGKVESSIRNDDPRNPATVADNVGDAVGSVVGTVVDLFESFVFSLVATAILGASLPFFYKDPFAICVTNHLYVDRICGPFGYPAALSHSQYICRTNNLYLSYPLLSIWQSNAAFVAVPFLLAIVAILASILTTSFMYISGDTSTKNKGAKQDDYGILRSLRINTFVSIALIAAGAAGICFGLFGNSSSFRAAPGQGSRDNVIYFKLSSATNSCGPAFPSPSGSSPLPTPQGTFELGRYRPFAAVNKEFDPASQTAWRLYICILVGLALGLIIRLLTETFMNCCHAGSRNRHG
jgi:Inorganic H+ pyrophosphatase